jgi:hypothetical protein
VIIPARDEGPVIGGTLDRLGPALPPGQAGVTYPWTYAVRAAFGQPARIYYAGGYTVLVWNRNLLSELRTSG